MSDVALTAASLRFGDRYLDVELDPDAVTAALGCPPTGSARKGEVRRRNGKVMTDSDGMPLIASVSGWQYSVDRREPGDLDGQIREIFGALTDDLSAWRPLAATYKPDLFVGMFLQDENEGIEISAESLRILADRGVSLSLDIYGPTGPEE
jgi:hypothetical protein